MITHLSVNYYEYTYYCINEDPCIYIYIYIYIIMKNKKIKDL